MKTKCYCWASLEKIKDIFQIWDEIPPPAHFRGEGSKENLICTEFYYKSPNNGNRYL